MSAHDVVTDDLRAAIRPSLPPEPPRPRGAARACRIARRWRVSFVYVLRGGSPWELLPQELGCGSGMTCGRRLRDWGAAGVWHRLHRRLLDCLGAADRIDWSRASVDSASLPAKKGGDAVGMNPTDRGTAQGAPGTERHLVVGRGGVPLAAGLTAANRPGQSVFEALVEAVAPIKRPRGWPRRRPATLHAEKGYDVARCRAYLRRRRIADRIARRGVEDKTRLGRHRWVVERPLAWLARYRRLAIRDERREEIHQALLDLACAHICSNSLRRPERFC